MIDSLPPARNPWLNGRTVESVVEGLSVTVMREARNGWVHVTLDMRRHDVDVLTGSIVLSAQSWETLVAELPAAGHGSSEAIRARGLDFDSTLSLSRRPTTDRVTIALRPTPMARASCTVSTVLDPEAWLQLVEVIRDVVKS